MRYDVARNFGLGKPETRRDFNQRFGMQAGPEPQVPTTVYYIWDWFWQLCRRRQRSEAGPQPLSYAEIDAWIRRGGVIVRDEEVRILLDMDDAYLSADAEESRAERDRKKNSPAPTTKRKYL